MVCFCTFVHESWSWQCHRVSVPLPTFRSAGHSTTTLQLVAEGRDLTRLHGQSLPRTKAPTAACHKVEAAVPSPLRTDTMRAQRHVRVPDQRPSDSAQPRAMTMQGGPRTTSAVIPLLRQVLRGLVTMRAQRHVRRKATRPRAEQARRLAQLVRSVMDIEHPHSRRDDLPLGL